MKNHTMSQAIQKNIEIPPIAYTYHGAEELTIKKDITYCVTSDKALCFDIYYPKHFVPFQAKSVLFVNGGGPIDKNYKSYPCYTSWAELSAVNNIVGITFNWRSGKSQDISNMLSYIEMNTDTLGITLEELIVFPLCRAVNNTLNCVFKYPQIKKMVMYYGKVNSNTNVKRCKDMHFFIALGNNDVKYPPKCNQWFIEKAEENGYRIEIVIHPQGRHGFDYANRDKYTKEIIERTINFIKQ